MSGTRVFGNSGAYNPGTAENPYGGGGQLRDVDGINSALARTGSSYRLPLDRQRPQQSQQPQWAPQQAPQTLQSSGLVDRGGGQITSQGTGVPLQELQQQQPLERQEKKEGFDIMSLLSLFG